MKQLKVNTIVPLADGRTATVLSLLGQGGQGTVYRVRVSGDDKDSALKVYAKRPSVAFLNNLSELIKYPITARTFMWPTARTSTPAYEGFVMPLRNPEYIPLTDILLGRAVYQSWSALTTSAVHLVRCFNHFHKEGRCFGDINPEGIFVDPKHGYVSICDCDNIRASQNTLAVSVLGKMRYMAPEIINGGMPDAHSDEYSVAIILALVLFGNHPLEGKLFAEQVCLTEQIEKRLYSNPVFVMDPKDSSNRPIIGVHTNIIKRWGLYPAFVREAFTRAFDHKTLMKPAKRITCDEWREILDRLRCSIVYCDCGHDTLYDLQKQEQACICCRRTIKRPLRLIYAGREAALTPDMAIPYTFRGEYSSLSHFADVVRNKNNPAIYGMRNMVLREKWKVTYPDGKTIDATFDSAFAIYEGCTIDMGNNRIMKIK